KRAYCLKTQPATGETYPKSDLFNKAKLLLKDNNYPSSVIKRRLPAVIILQGCLLSVSQETSDFYSLHNNVVDILR
ncbi:hypothetical protein ACJEI1_11090, partial [Escherichia coli]